MARIPTRRPPSMVTRACWDRAALRWERFEPQFMHSLAAVDPVLFRAMRLRPGQQVLDVGCGSGEPSLAIARFVAPRGAVTGLDISPRMLAIARLRARHRGVPNARFKVADLGRDLLPRARYHAIASRFSLMFVADVPRVLGALRTALRPGGRAAFAVWGPLGRNPIARLSAEATRRFSKVPAPRPASGPHPLRLARRGALAGMMREVGFEDITDVGVRAPFVYGSVDEFLAIQLGYPNALRDVYLALSRRDQGRMRAQLARGIRRFRSGPVIRVPGFAWVVAGRR